MMTTTKTTKKTTTKTTKETPDMTTTKTPDAPAAPAAPTTKETPDMTTTKTPAVTPAPAPDFGAALLAAVRADGTDGAAPSIEAAVVALRAVTPVKRGAAEAAGLSAVITADAKLAPAAVRIVAAIKSALATKPAKVTADPAAVRADRLAALLLAVTSIGRPDGTDDGRTLALLADRIGADAAAAFATAAAAVTTVKTPDDIRVPINKAADRAAAAVTRGQSNGRTAKDRKLADAPAGAVTYRGQSADVTPAGLVYAGKTYTAPTPAAIAAAVTAGADPAKVSVNGWEAWKYADGRTLADVIDGADVTPDGAAA